MRWMNQRDHVNLTRCMKMKFLNPLLVMAALFVSSVVTAEDKAATNPFGLVYKGALTQNQKTKVKLRTRSSFYTPGFMPSFVTVSFLISLPLTTR